MRRKRENIMVEIRTMKNYLITDEDKNGYCFRSTTNQILSQNELAKEFSNYNSTITEPDALGMLNIENTIICRYLRLGYMIELPWCWIYARANGTTDNPDGMFSPGAGDHKFNIILEMKKDALERIIDDVEYKQLGADFVGDPKILRVLTLDDNAEESKSLDVAAGNAVRLRGHNLKMDLTDGEQGVFLVQGDLKTRLTKYNRLGTNIVDVIVPQATAPGAYAVRIVTKPGVSRYAEHTFSDTITVNDGAQG